MARVVEKRRDGTVMVEVPAVEAVGLVVGASVDVRRASAWPRPFGALAGELPPIEIEDIKAARRDALRGCTP